MIRIKFFVFVVISLLVIWSLIIGSNDNNNTQEHFTLYDDITYDASSHPFKSNEMGKFKHVKFSCDMSYACTDLMSPTNNGQKDCAAIPCPDYVDQNSTCWLCCKYD